MKIVKLLLLLPLLLSQTLISQNLTYSNLSQTVDALPDSEVVVKVPVSCTGSSTTPVSINPTFCVFDSGLTGLTFSNGGYLLPGEKAEIIFKFKKTVTADETFTYKFSTNNSCFQAESQMIKITVNYKKVYEMPPLLPKPTNVSFVSYSDKISFKWNPVAGAKSYYVLYLNAQGKEVITLVKEPSIILSDLVPNTKYDWWIQAQPFSAPPPLYHGSGNFALGTTYTEGPNPPYLDGSDFFCATATSGYTQRYAIFYTPRYYTSINWEVEPSYAVSILPNMGNDLVIRRASSVPFTIKATIKFNGKNDLVFIKNISNSCQVSALKSLDKINFPSNLIVSSACSTSGGVCGIANFQWTPSNEAVFHEVEYMILNYASNNPKPITGSFQTKNSFYTAYGMEVTNNLEAWRINFRVRSQNQNGVWSDFSPWSANFVW